MTEAQTGARNRLEELDLVRGLAVILMVVEHVNMYMTSLPLLDNPLFRITQAGIGDVAVIFMFLMGMNTVFSRSATPGKVFVRGLRLFIFSYCFNFLRDFLPAVIGCRLGRATLADCEYANFLDPILYVDILQFVGLAFMFIGLLRALKTPPAWELGIGFLISFATLVLGKRPTTETFASWPLDLIIGGWHGNYFPFMNWIIYPLAGAWLGRKLKALGNRDAFYITSTRWSMRLYLLGWAGLLYFYPFIDFFGWHDPFDYYRQRLLGNVFFLSESMLLIGVSYFSLKVGLVPESVRRFIVFWSENITSLYIVSWLILSWTTWTVTGFHGIRNPLLAVAATVGLMAVSHLLVKHCPFIPRMLKHIC